MFHIQISAAQAGPARERESRKARRQAVQNAAALSMLALDEEEARRMEA